MLLRRDNRTWWFVTLRRDNGTWWFVALRRDNGTWWFVALRRDNGTRRFAGLRRIHRKHEDSQESSNWENMYLTKEGMLIVKTCQHFPICTTDMFKSEKEKCALLATVMITLCCKLYKYIKRSDNMIG